MESVTSYRTLMRFVSLTAIVFEINCEHFEKTLIEDLLMNYNNEVRPVENRSQVLIVTVGVQPYRLLRMDEIEQLIRMSMWYRLSWEDSALSWKPDRYGNITRINLPVDVIWTPPVGLLNSLDSGMALLFSGGEDVLDNQVQVQFNGHVRLLLPAVLSVSCIMDMSMYPFDTQRCNLRFGTWAYTTDDLAFKADVETSTLAQSKENFSSSAGWNVLEYRAIETKGNNNEESPSVTFTIELQRQTTYYIVILLLPCFSNVMLTLLVFLLPPETGERIAVGINTLFTMWVNYLRVLNAMPKSPHLPAFCKFYYFVMFECVCAIAVSCLVISFFHMNVNIDQPEWVKTHILDRMARLVFLHKSVKYRLKTAEKLKKEAEMFRSRFEGKSYPKITIGLNLFVDNSLKDFETFWRQEEWKLVSLVLERFFTYFFLFSVLISFFVFAVTVR
ncbi:neuronal acetylcholine receptor subunit alpha-9-like [Acropora muricata]|uniref:neuronal acetylcholine receptor subunit alpha-9-like n=1 Tax=Acropora muricata TaxID=159855 RepID=UPI0034E46169